MFEELNVWKPLGLSVAIRLTLLKNLVSGAYCVVDANVIGESEDLVDDDAVFGGGIIAERILKTISGRFGVWHPDLADAVNTFDLEQIVE